MVQILDGKHQAELLKSDLIKRIADLKNKDVHPKLAVVLVGDDPASHLYVKKKQEKAAQLGIEATLYRLPADTTQQKLHEQLGALNQDNTVHGILLQLPLPKHLDTLEALKNIDPDKDVDGLTPTNVGLFSLNVPNFIPCTPQGCLHLIHLWKKDLKGLNALVIGRSALVGSPVARLLLQENCTVTMAHSHTVNIADLCHHADIVIAAIGKKNFVQGTWVKSGACLIDVGINPLDDQRITGDIDFDTATKVAGAISPVPGGVGPLTVIFLMTNTVKAAEQQGKAS